MPAHSSEISQANAVRVSLAAVVGTLLALVGFSGALSELVNRWAHHEEYSHGFLIPIVTVFLLWMRRDALRTSIGRRSWTGPAVTMLAVVMNVIGQMSAILILSQLGFIVAIIGLVLSLGGYSLLKAAFFPIFFLLFAIPVPDIIDSMASLQLQLISSELGTLFIRLFRIPVYLEGNVIDLGYYKVQVVEACSGLRYLYPLMSLSFLAAYMFNAPLWQRGLVFLSSIPITIALNSLRIGLVGVTVNYWGAQAANELLHFFEGWVIFLACAGTIALMIYFFARISGQTFTNAFYLPGVVGELPQVRAAKSGYQILTCLFLLGATGMATYYVAGRSEIIPDRPRFVAFPGQIGSWQGRTSLLEPETERMVHLDDYILSDYTGSDGKMVNLYVAYYGSQRKGNRPHSPSDCIPGSGWRITKFERTAYDDSGTKFALNRAIIEKDSIKQVVYYWFDERGRKIANEYLAKWFIHADAILMNRTDGALVRLITQIHGGESEYDADQRLQNFIHDTVPTLEKYLPSEIAQQVRPVRFGSNRAQL